MIDEILRSELADLSPNPVIVLDNPEYDAAIVGYVCDYKRACVHVVYDVREMVDIAMDRCGGDEEQAAMIVQDAFTAAYSRSANYPLILEHTEE